jgi:alanine-synthesizing transaminase
MPDISDIRAKITSKTRGIVLINPNNPTGAVYAPELLEQIVKLAYEHDLVLFADEIYDRMTMDGYTHTPLASISSDVFCVTFNGLSKSHLIAGYRVGWMVLSGNKANAKSYIEGLNMLSSMRLCSNVPGQYAIPAALKCLESTSPMLVPGGRVYEQRRVICDALESIPGISLVRPKATFYCFPKIDAKSFGIINDERFVLDFLREKKVLLVHGRAFHWPDPDHFRIVYLPNVDVLADAAGKLRDFLETYHQD